jgi:bifunctional non-homologous end joining protein LigD
MEPVLSKQLLVHPDYVYQVKWDGIRILSKIEQDNVILHTRHGNIRTHTYPEITQLLLNQFAGKSIYLDGEMISIYQGKSDFFQVLKRDRLKTPSKIEPAVRRIPVCYMVFDILYDDQWVTDKSFHERNEILNSIISPTDQFQLCPTTTDGEALFSYTKEQGWEGIVAKKRAGKYHIGEKHTTWRKIKHFQHLESTILGVTLKSGKVYSLLLGTKKNDEEWHYIGRVSSGLDTEEKKLLTEYSKFLQIPTPVALIPPFHEEEIRWFFPDIHVEIRFLEWTPDRTLRSPVIERFLPR